MNKTILVAGGSGFIGSSLYSYLEAEYIIVSLDYSNSQTEKDFINLDLTDINKVNNFTESCNSFDILIFLVGLAHTKGRGKDLPAFKNINYQTLVNLISSLKKNNKVPKKIIFASTISVYGERYNRNIYYEDLIPKPFSPYAETKFQAEQYLLKSFGNKSWILRFAPVYSSLFLLNIDRRTKIGYRFYRVGKGLKKLSLCNIENIKVAIDAIINENVPVGVYNLSDQTEYSYDKLLRWKKANGVLHVPVFFVKLLYYLGKYINSTFLKENSIKLISDNIFPSDKICSFVELSYTLNNEKVNQKRNS